MRFELFLFAITAFIVGNIYTDGKLFAWALSKRKYYQMALIMGAAIVLYWSFRGAPSSIHSLAKRSSEIMKYLPIDSTTSSMINPILDFTSRHSFIASDIQGAINKPILPLHPPQLGGKGYHAEGYPTRVKRSVGETRKKNGCRFSKLEMQPLYNPIKCIL